MTSLEIWILVLAAQTLVMACAWLTQRQVGNAGWVDVFWTYSTGAGAVICALLPASGAVSWRAVLVAAMTAIWSARLGTYIAIRVGRSPSEDVRYRTFREEWGADFQRRMFRFIIVQGPISAVLAGGVLLAAHARAPFPGIADIAGIALFAAGVAIEAVADRQMRRFRHRPGASKSAALCDQGLWGWSRHPNYIGEFLLWCAIPVIAIGATPLDPVAWLSLAAPAMMYWLLVHVSGIPPLEQAMEKSRGQAWHDYAARVPAFMPRLFSHRRSAP